MQKNRQRKSMAGAALWIHQEESGTQIPIQETWRVTKKGALSSETKSNGRTIHV